MSFQGKVALVTGAARGLGRDYAEMFAADGACVAVADINDTQAEEVAAGINGRGGQALAVKVDVADEASTLAMARSTVDRFGRLDILVNNAGIWGDYERAGPLEIRPEYWDFVMAVNLKGPLLCSRAAVPHMRERQWGRIVNISTVGAYLPLGGPYEASKLALLNLTWGLAAAVGQDGITVNAVCPGAMDTEATRKQVGAHLPPGMSFEQAIGQRSIIKRPGYGRDIYGMIRYLCSDDAEWVTGQTMLVTGGYEGICPY